MSSALCSYTMTLTTGLVVGMRPDISTTLPRRLVGLSSSLALRSRARERSARLPGPVQAGRGFGKNEEKPKAQEPQGVEMKEADVPIDNASTSGRLEVATSSDISEEVTDRALQRMLTFSGIPFAVGLVFFPRKFFSSLVVCHSPSSSYHPLFFLKTVSN